MLVGGLDQGVEMLQLLGGLLLQPEVEVSDVALGDLDQVVPGQA